MGFQRRGAVFHAFARLAMTRSSSGVPRVISARDRAIVPRSKSPLGPFGSFGNSSNVLMKERDGRRGGSAENSQRPGGRLLSHLVRKSENFAENLDGPRQQVPFRRSVHEGLRRLLDDIDGREGLRGFPLVGVIELLAK